MVFKLNGKEIATYYANAYYLVTSDSSINYCVMRFFISVLFIGFCCMFKAYGAKYQVLEVDSSALPKVFILGEHEQAYQRLYEQHSKVLLEVCQEDMDVAFDKWLSMLEEMEAYAKSINYDIKGIKVWLNVFWDENGKINHIAYHLKVNSRNIKREELTAFFSSFMNHYTFPVVTDEKFSHYGSASFPTFARRIKPSKSSQQANSKKKTKLPKDSVGSKY